MRSSLLLVAVLLTAVPAQAQGTLADRIEDLRRTAAVRAALAEDAQTRAYDAGVVTEGGVVTLSGEVGSTSARERAEALAQEVRGVRAVRNGLHVPGQPDVAVTQAGLSTVTETAETAEVEEPAPRTSVAEPETDAAAQPVYHTVRSGDTLYSIARRYGTTVQALQRLNRLDSANIRLGQRLRVR